MATTEHSFSIGDRIQTNDGDKGVVAAITIDANGNASYVVDLDRPRERDGAPRDVYSEHVLRADPG